ncbi:lipopolysaccharide assembly protein LapA domain-containing protein [Aliiglaciecola sp. LCG003]|uniref:LapA family protein n=1 Tax=Aliiglaciecola sp. LCG003 TaxID=3053655 RepID=UPI0025745C51|nr:lipopolysaccharide assembly protein LapA domain-containing protein [Aliiglaciecola sp. LCG003]WJG11164.1 lipopolysaccharide assembly protein LapA domain-containing protein [Aliiglaciecola sp. LCG003]
MKIFLIVVIFILIMLIAGLLGAKNDQIINFDYLLATIEMRLSMLLMLFFAAGTALSGLVFALIWLRLKWRIGKLKKNSRVSDASSN